MHVYKYINTRVFDSPIKENHLKTPDKQLCTKEKKKPNLYLFEIFNNILIICSIILNIIFCYHSHYYYIFLYIIYIF